MQTAIRLAVAATSLSLIAAGCADASKKSAATRPALGATSASTSTRPAAGPVTAASLMARVRPSLVVVEYTYDGETGRREIQGAGIVVGADGLVAVAGGIFPPQIPDAQMINFKVIVPPGVEGVDKAEYPAKFLGRDERAELAYVRVEPKAAATQPDAPAKTWAALAPADDAGKLAIGQPIWTVGVLTEDSGYAAYVRRSTVDANLRGPVPLVLTDGNLTAVGSPAFDVDGRFVAIVPQQEGQSPLLNPGNDVPAASSLTNPPLFVVGLDYFRASLNDPPTAPGSRKQPWLGIVQMSGLSKEVADVYGLNGRPAIQIGDIVPGGPAAEAGLEGGAIVTKVNGQDLERGDVPDELPMILARQLARMNVGDRVTLTTLAKPGAEPKDVTVTLGERPAQANTADRFYAEDLGFTVRDLVFNDRYARRLEDDFGGVVATFVKPQGSAQAGGLKPNDVITKLNQLDVKNVEGFKDAYESFRKVSPKEAVVFEVLRGADTQIIRVQPPQ